MSIHRSLRGVDTLRGERSVVTRIERIQILRKEGRFDPETSSALGLPKVRTKFKIVGGKKAKPTAAEKAEKAASKKAAEKPAAPEKKKK